MRNYFGGVVLVLRGLAQDGSALIQFVTRSDRIHDTDTFMQSAIFLQGFGRVKAAGVHADQRLASSVNVFLLLCRPVVW